ncbi:hypothetical protein XENORESO_021815 [Xenotaenia resolanae]|uniref:Protein kinase domain-containing protein n=1 Tax=Xenotaenia resolanae TaxID=208358 RepID=A0ABV0W867_9TELE
MSHHQVFLLQAGLHRKKVWIIRYEDRQPCKLVFRPDRPSFLQQHKGEKLDKISDMVLKMIVFLLFLYAFDKIFLSLTWISWMAYSTGTLAKGCFGKVYRQRYNDTWAAVKKVPQQLIDRKNLERECELTPSNKATIITGMCEGLLHLHLNDIVHQDLKPENIMVEHGTNRAVIIDLGLAKFFRHGLSSAIDMGNEAYSAPEVLTMGSQRSQRSDVWAMGKIIAELYVRIRLHTPSVGPAKIKETLQGQPYCDTVCRMVEPDPSRRATMAGVIDEIRVAGRAANPTSTPIGLPNPPFTKPMEDKNRQPGLVPPGRADVMPDLMKMRLQQNGAQDLPSNLPKTGKMVVRHIKQNNGKIETWEKTVVTEGGKIIRYEDVKINS